MSSTAKSFMARCMRSKEVLFQTNSAVQLAVVAVGALERSSSVISSVASESLMTWPMLVHGRFSEPAQVLRSLISSPAVANTHHSAEMHCELACGLEQVSLNAGNS